MSRLIEARLIRYLEATFGPLIDRTEGARAAMVRDWARLILACDQERQRREGRA